MAPAVWGVWRANSSASWAANSTLVIDRKAQQLAREPCWSGLRLVHPDDVSSRDKSRLRVAVSIVTAPYVPLEQTLRQLGFADVVPFYDLAESFRAVHPLSNGWFAEPLTSTRSDEDRRGAGALDR